MTEDIKKKLDIIGVNQAGAYDIALTIYDLWTKREGDFKDLSFIDWCNYMYEDAPYDEFN